jgi:hypothetical protein
VANCSKTATCKRPVVERNLSRLDRRTEFIPCRLWGTEFIPFRSPRRSALLKTRSDARWLSDARAAFFGGTFFDDATRVSRYPLSIGLSRADRPSANRPPSSLPRPAPIHSPAVRERSQKRPYSEATAGTKDMAIAVAGFKVWVSCTGRSSQLAQRVAPTPIAVTTPSFAKSHPPAGQGHSALRNWRAPAKADRSKSLQGLVLRSRRFARPRRIACGPPQFARLTALPQRYEKYGCHSVSSVFACRSTQLLPLRQKWRGLTKNRYQAGIRLIANNCCQRLY